MTTAAKVAAPTLRLASLDDGARIADLEASQKLGSMPADDWRNLWLNNPLWPRLRHEWPVGWLLEDAGGRLVGSLVNVPAALHVSRTQTCLCQRPRLGVDARVSRLCAAVDV